MAVAIQGVRSQVREELIVIKDVDAIIEHLENVNDTWARLVEIAIGLWLLERQLGATCVVPVVVVLGEPVLLRLNDRSTDKEFLPMKYALEPKCWLRKELGLISRLGIKSSKGGLRILLPS